MFPRSIFLRILRIFKCIIDRVILLLCDEGPGFSEISPDMRVINSTTNEKCRFKGEKFSASGEIST